MRRKPFPLTDISQGLDVSMIPIFLTNGASPNLNCLRFYKGLIKKDLGFIPFLDDAPERPMRLYMYTKWTGTVYYMLATVDDLYYIDSGSWTQVRPDPGSNPSFTGDADNMFSFTTFADTLVVTNGKDDIYTFDGTDMAVIAGLSGKKAKIVEKFYNTLVLGWTIESGVEIPYRVRWCEVGDIETWVGGNAGFIDLLDTPDRIMNIIPLGDRLFVFKEWSIWEIFYNGGSGNGLFDKKLVNDSMGTYAPWSCISLGEEIIFFGNDSLYTFDGLSVREIGSPIRSLLYETDQTFIGHSKLNRSVAAYCEESRDYILALPTKDNSNPNYIVKYNLDNKSISVRTKEVSAFGYYSVSQTFTSWASAKSGGSNWNDSEWQIPWKRLVLPDGATTILYANPDGTIEEDNRITLSNEVMLWESKDFILGQSERWLGVELMCRGGDFEISYSKDQGVSWSIYKTYTPASESSFNITFCEIDDTSNTLRFRIRSSNQLEFYLPAPWYIDRARHHIN